MKKIIFPIIFGAIILVGAFQCPLYAYIGIPCPSCGMTRAWRLLLLGDVAGAFMMHPLLLLPPLLLLQPFQKKWVIWLMAGLLLAVYIWRMVTFFPETAPMNYNYDSLIGGFLR